MICTDSFSHKRGNVSLVTSFSFCTNFCIFVPMAKEMYPKFAHSKQSDLYFWPKYKTYITTQFNDFSKPLWYFFPFLVNTHFYYLKTLLNVSDKDVNFIFPFQIINTNSSFQDNTALSYRSTINGFTWSIQSMIYSMKKMVCRRKKNTSK